MQLPWKALAGKAARWLLPHIKDELLKEVEKRTSDPARRTGFPISGGRDVAGTPEG